MALWLIHEWVPLISIETLAVTADMPFNCCRCVHVPDDVLVLHQ
jgi:hypothetical protein